MKLLYVSKILLIILIPIFLFSCSTESYVLNASKFYTNKADKKYQIDSFKVVKVIDNRKTKDSIIGIADEDNNKLTINRPLVDYLKLGFNTLICKDSNQTNFIPVTVYVDEFFSDRSYSFWRQCANNKFSYLFEYPLNSEIKKIRIQDSLIKCDEPSVLEQKSLINAGIRETARMFTWSIKNKIFEDSTYKSYKDSLKSDIDSIDLIKAYNFDYKYGLLINSYYGKKINFSLLLSFLEMISQKSIKFEEGLCWGFQFFNASNSKDNGIMYGLTFTHIFRFNLNNTKDGLYLDGNFNLLAGGERVNNSSNHFYYGGRIEESIGYYLTKNIALNAGFYQLGLFGSKLLPTDIGFVFSLSITSDYSMN